MTVPSRPLIVRLRNWVGDVILGIPALKLLQSHGYALELVGKPWAKSLMAGHGWPVHARAGSLRQRVAQLSALRQQCRRQDPGYDRRENALIFPTSFSAALEMRLAGLKAVGYAQEARGILLRRSEKITYGKHALQSYWDLACAFLRVSLPPPDRIGLQTTEQDQREAQNLIDAHQLSRGFVVLCPFAGGKFEKQDKTWPQFPEFTSLLDPHMLAQGRSLVACPGRGEEQIILDHHPGVKILPNVSLGVYAAILKHAALVVSNDTGPGHMAASVGAPLLSVLGPTKPEQWAPWGPGVTIVRQWPQWPTPSAVLADALRMLADHGAAPGPWHIETKGQP